VKRAILLFLSDLSGLPLEELLKRALCEGFCKLGNKVIKSLGTGISKRTPQAGKPCLREKTRTPREDFTLRSILRKRLNVVNVTAEPHFSLLLERARAVDAGGNANAARSAGISGFSFSAPQCPGPD
jgi:hypothetical protein